MLATARQKKVVCAGKALVRHFHGHTTVFHQRQVDYRLGVLGQDRHHLTVDSEPGNSTVRVHSQAEMCVVLLGETTGTHKVVFQAWVALDLGDDVLPLRVGADFGVVVGTNTFHRDERSSVTGEMSGVDLTANDSCRAHASFEDHPISFLGVVSSGFPAVKPLSRVDKLGWVKHHWSGLDQVGCWSEKLVQEAQHLAPQFLANHVDVVGDDLLVEFLLGVNLGHLSLLL